VDNDKDYWDNSSTPVNTFTTGAPTTPVNIYLGAIDNNGAAMNMFSGQIYSFTINKPGSVDDRNMVPVCNVAQNVGGMLDTIHNVFYPSIGPNQFGC
jgi:hypothetical protein